MRLLAFLFLLSGLATAQVDIVFDLDWTLVYSVDEELASEARTIRVEGKYYRLADGAEDVIAALHSSPDFRVSFFSGGEKARNHKLLKQIFLPNSNKSLYEVAHKILSKEDLAVHSTDPDAAFTQRYKKDLRLVNEDLGKVVLIDDLKEFTPAGQKKNLFWLGKTYVYAEDFASASYGAYSPPSELAWLHERKKLYWTYDALEKASLRAKEVGGSFVDNLRATIKESPPYWPTMKNIKRAEIAAGKLAKGLAHGAKSPISCASLFLP